MKKLNIVGAVLAISLLSAVAGPVGQAVTTKAEETDMANQVFLEFVLSDTNYQGEITYTYSPLYDEELKVSGRQYDFTVGDIEGYALMAELESENKTFYEIEELFYNKQSPFDECEGLPVYVAQGLYLEYRDNAFYDVLNNNVMSEEEVKEKAYKGFGYCGGGKFVEKVQTVNYTKKDTETYSIPYDLPSYYGKSENDTSCANTAGAIVLGYYDRFNENLIPNYKSYIKLGNMIRYRTGTVEITNLLNELHDLMGTDVGHLGTTYSGFQDGMQRYVSGKGYSYRTSNIFSWGEFDFEKYKSAVEAENPVVLFLSNYAIVKTFSDTFPTDKITSEYMDVTHVAVGCGYKTDTYYDGQGKVSDRRNYLRVASGLEEYGIGYLNINGLGTIDKAISVEIS